jgi:hypothetical protein
MAKGSGASPTSDAGRPAAAAAAASRAISSRDP